MRTLARSLFDATKGAKRFFDLENPRDLAVLDDPLLALESQNGLVVLDEVQRRITDGDDLIATRFAFDFGCYGQNVHEANLNYLSLWYTFGKEYGFHEGEWKVIGGADESDSVLVASEPLTTDSSCGTHSSAMISASSW